MNQLRRECDRIWGKIQIAKCVVPRYTGFFFACVIVVAKSTPPWARSENCFYPKSPETRTSATVLTTQLIEWPPGEGLSERNVAVGAEEARARKARSSEVVSRLVKLARVPLSFVFSVPSTSLQAGATRPCSSSGLTAQLPGHLWPPLRDFQMFCKSLKRVTKEPH